MLLKRSQPLGSTVSKGVRSMQQYVMVGRVKITPTLMADVQGFPAQDWSKHHSVSTSLSSSHGVSFHGPICSQVNKAPSHQTSLKENVFSETKLFLHCFLVQFWCSRAHY